MAGMVLNLVRLVFLLLLIAAVTLFILAKSGLSKKGEEDALAQAEPAVPVDTIEGEFGKGWTDLKYRVDYSWQGKKLNYELFIHPFDPRVERLRKEGMELVLLSFLNEEEDRVVPKTPARIEMRELTLVTAKREDGTEYFSGWKYSASVQKEDEVEGEIADAEMGWLFSKELLTVLRSIRRERLIREANQQDGSNDLPAVSQLDASEL